MGEQDQDTIFVAVAFASPLLVIGAAAILDKMGHTNYAGRVQGYVDNWFKPMRDRSSLLGKLALGFGLVIAGIFACFGLWMLLILALATEAALFGGIIAGIVALISLPLGGTETVPDSVWGTIFVLAVVAGSFLALLLIEDS